LSAFRVVRDARAPERHTAALWARLERLHRDLADCYRDLLGRGEKDGEDVLESGQIRVAAGAEQSDITSVPKPRKMLSAKALADLLDVDAKTVRRWREEGRVPEPVQIGGVIRWRPEDIDAWLGGDR